MNAVKEIDRYLANLREERGSAALYRAMAEHGENDQMAGIFLRLCSRRAMLSFETARRLLQSS